MNNHTHPLIFVREWRREERPSTQVSCKALYLVSKKRIQFFELFQDDFCHGSYSTKSGTQHGRAFQERGDSPSWENTLCIYPAGSSKKVQQSLVICSINLVESREQISSHGGVEHYACHDKKQNLTKHRVANQCNISQQDKNVFHNKTKSMDRISSLLNRYPFRVLHTSLFAFQITTINALSAAA